MEIDIRKVLLKVFNKNVVAKDWLKITREPYAGALPTD